MTKRVEDLRKPDPYFAGTAGFLGSTLEDLHRDMQAFSLPATVSVDVRRAHDAVCHAYIYSYYSYDLLTLAAAQTFPCLELALRELFGQHFAGRVDRKGKPLPPPSLDALLRKAKSEGRISAEIEYLAQLRNMFAHGSGAVVNPPMFLPVFGLVTGMLLELYGAG